MPSRVQHGVKRQRDAASDLPRGDATLMIRHAAIAGTRRCCDVAVCCQRLPARRHHAAAPPQRRRRRRVAPRRANDVATALIMSSPCYNRRRVTPQTFTAATIILSAPPAPRERDAMLMMPRAIPLFYDAAPRDA